MLLKKKLCIFALFCGVLLFWFASHTIQRNFFLPVMIKASRSTSRTPRIIRTQTKTVTQMSQQRLCSCPTCITDPGVSEWFDKRFDSLQQPYLSPKENQIDPVSLKWWLVSIVSIVNRIAYYLLKIIWYLMSAGKGFFF